MADNVAVTAGAGTSIATEDEGGVHYQKVKLTASGSGTTEALSKAEDSAHTSGDHGIAMLGVVKTTAAGLTTTDGDYTMPQFTPTGALRICNAEDEVGSNVDSDDNAIVTLNTAKLAAGLVTLTPKFVAIAASSSGDNTLLAAVVGKKIRVLAYSLSFAGAVNARFESGAGGTALTGLKYGTTNVQVVAPFNPVGWFETAVNTLLNLELSGAVAVGGELVYVEVA